MGVSGGDAVFCRIRIPQNGSAGADRTAACGGNFMECAALTVRNGGAAHIHIKARFGTVGMFYRTASRLDVSDTERSIAQSFPVS